MGFLNCRSAITIDIFLALTVLIGFSFNLYGLKNINWMLCSAVSEALFVIPCTFLGITFFFITIMIYLRYKNKNKKNTTFNDIEIYSIYFLVAVNIIGYTFSIISIILSLINLVFLGAENDDDTKILVKNQLAYILVSMVFALLNYSFQIPLWYLLLQRVKLEINGTIDEEGIAISN